MDKRQTRRGGFYWRNDKPYLSVTEILKVIDKPALRYWYGREVYYAMLKDPSLNEKDALAAPYKKSSKAKDRGTTIHSIIEAYKQTGAVLDGIPDDFQGYATAFYNFMKDVKPVLIEQEKTVLDEENRTAGTLDMYCQIGNGFYLVDAKTGKDIYPEVGLQNSAYANGMRLEGKQVDGIAVVLLETGTDDKPTGNYKFAHLTEDFDAFLAAKKLYEWQNREKLIKVGYLTV